MAVAHPSAIHAARIGDDLEAGLGLERGDKTAEHVPKSVTQPADGSRDF